MVKRKCIEDYCDEKPAYCGEHFWELKRKLSNRNYTLLVLVLGLLSVFLLYGTLLRNVDEDKFCQEKVNKYFPEFKFERVYGGVDECIGEVMVNKGNIKRDGFTLVEGGDKRVIKQFALDEEGKKYVQSDDGYGVLFILGLSLIFILVIIIGNWLDYWRLVI